MNTISIIIPIYQEKKNKNLYYLLESLYNQNDNIFEIIIVDDGSPNDYIIEEYLKFKNKLNISFYKTRNNGSAIAKNYGAKKAKGDYFVFLDSDTEVPINYIKKIRYNLIYNYTECFGGPDSLIKDNKKILENAINFCMTSFITTVGIRGNKNNLNKFQPRSFNMGVSKYAFNKVNGFSNIKIGEDIDLVIKLWKNNIQTKLYIDCKVYHKRKINFYKFYKQVFNFGYARALLNDKYKFKNIYFYIPVIYVLTILLYFLSIIIKCIIIKNIIDYIILLYIFILILICYYKTKCIKTALLSFVIMFIQITSYSIGYMKFYILKKIKNVIKN